MKKRIYITETEHEKCKKIMNAFSELYEEVDTIVLDAGKYGFVKLQYYTFGFDVVITYTESGMMFDDLWEEWLEAQLLKLSRGTPMSEMACEDIFECLPKEKQDELMSKRIYFAQKAEI